AAKTTWEAIQRIELSTSEEAAGQILDQAARAMGCRRIRIDDDDLGPIDQTAGEVSGPSAIFRLSGVRGRWITMELSLGAETPLAADIVFRCMQRLGQAMAGRVERLEEAADDPPSTLRSPAETFRQVERADEGSQADPPDRSPDPRR